MNNNEPETIARLPSRPLARSAAAGLACLLAASWVAPASANVVTEFNAIGADLPLSPGPGCVIDLALVQVAVHDAVQAIEQRYETVSPRRRDRDGLEGRCGCGGCVPRAVRQPHLRAAGRTCRGPASRARRAVHSRT